MPFFCSTWDIFVQHFDPAQLVCAAQILFMSGKGRGGWHSVGHCWESMEGQEGFSYLDIYFLRLGEKASIDRLPRPNWSPVGTWFFIKAGFSMRFFSWPDCCPDSQARAQVPQMLGVQGSQSYLTWNEGTWLIISYILQLWRSLE